MLSSPDRLFVVVFSVSLAACCCLSLIGCFQAFILTVWRSLLLQLEFTCLLQVTVRLVRSVVRLTERHNGHIEAGSPDLPLQVTSLSPQMEVRALVEGQFLSRRLHSERLGYSISKISASSLLHHCLADLVRNSDTCHVMVTAHLFVLSCRITSVGNWRSFIQQRDPAGQWSSVM